MSRYRVLFVTSWYPDRSNPMAGVFVQEHAMAVQQYDEVRVLHLAGRLPPSSTRDWLFEEETDTELSRGIPTYRVRYRQSNIRGKSLLSLTNTHWRAVNLIRRDGFEPDILHAHVYSAGAQAVLYGRLHRLPVVVTEHNSAFPRRLLNRRQLWQARVAFQGACRILPVSNALKNGIRAYGFPLKNCTIIPNAVDAAIFSPPDKAHLKNIVAKRPSRLLTIGSLIDIKGIDYLLDALAQVNQQVVDWRLDIIGDGANRNRYEQRVLELGLDEQVCFHGYQPKSRIAEMMREASCLIHPSLWENLPCVLLEATVSGLPIIATSVGGIPEIVHKENGVLIPPSDPTALAHAILDLLSTPERYDRLAIAQNAQQYSLFNVGARIHDLYSSCLS